MLKIRDDAKILKKDLETKLLILVDDLEESADQSVTWLEHKEQYDNNLEKLLARRNQLLPMIAELQRDIENTVSIYTELAHDRMAVRSL